MRRSRQSSGFNDSSLGLFGDDGHDDSGGLLSDYNPIYNSNIGGSIVVGCTLAGPIAVARDPNKLVMLGTIAVR